jgi:hypothetical protein
MIFYDKCNVIRTGSSLEIDCDDEEKEERYYVKIRSDIAVVVIDSYGRVVDRFVKVYYPRYNNSIYLFEKKLNQMKKLDIDTVEKLLETYYTEEKRESFEYAWEKYKRKMRENVPLTEFT